MIVLLGLFVFLAGVFVAEQSISYVLAAALIAIFTSLSVEALYRKNVGDAAKTYDTPEQEPLNKLFIEVILYTVSGQEILATFDPRVVSLETVKFFVKGYLTANGYPLNLVHVSNSKSQNSIIYSYGKNSTDKKDLIRITNINNFYQEENADLIAAYA